MKVTSALRAAGEESKTCYYEHDYHERWDEDLLQGLGIGAGGCVQPWVAAERGCV
jgi:hypothetical protein